MLPFIDSQFQPRIRGDRPLPVPRRSRNLGFISQFVEIPDDVVFTVEYSVRAAQIAAYELLGLDKKRIPAVRHHERTMRIKLQALRTAYRKGRGKVGAVRRRSAPAA